MKAAQIQSYGDASVINITEIDVPQPQKGQVLIEVHASSINPFDSKLRSGAMQQMIPLQFPATLGGDVAGIITKLGPEVQGLIVGDTVYGQANVVAGNSGAFAEYASTAAAQVAKAPGNLALTQAAALPLVGVSALQALTEHLQLKPGQKLFIHGGAGGIGSIAIQIAKHIGAYVAVTATGEGVTYATQRGADQVIDYKTQDFATVLHDFDAVYDTVGGDDFAKSLVILKPGGIAVSMTAQIPEEAAAEQDVTAITQATKVTTERLNRLRELVENGAVVPHVDKTFPLAQVQEAFRALETGSVKGKVVLQIKD